MRKATLAQVRKGRGGRLIEIGQDVLDVCARLKEIDERLAVDYNEVGGYFRISELGDDGKVRAVCYVQELSADIPSHIQRLGVENYALELERADAQADRDREHTFHEQLGPIGERLHHAIGKDLGWKHRAFVPKEV